VHLYLSEIIPKLNDLDRKLNDEGMGDLGDKVEVSFGNDNLEIRFRPTSDFFEKSDSILESMLNVLNLIESFSHPFATGVASERVAFESVGATYVGSVKKLLPIVVVAGGENFKSTARLYSIWCRRLEADRLAKKQRKISEELEKFQGDKIAIPIGDGRD
jgi:hypothetical protein